MAGSKSDSGPFPWVIKHDLGPWLRGRQMRTTHPSRHPGVYSGGHGTLTCSLTCLEPQQAARSPGGWRDTASPCSPLGLPPSVASAGWADLTQELTSEGGAGPSHPSSGHGAIQMHGGRGGAALALHGKRTKKAPEVFCVAALPLEGRRQSYDTTPSVAVQPADPTVSSRL